MRPTDCSFLVNCAGFIRGFRVRERAASLGYMDDKGEYNIKFRQ